MPDALQRATEATRLREYLRANMFDGCEDGTLSAPIRTHLDTIVELVGDWLSEDAAGVQGLVEALEKWKCDSCYGGLVIKTAVQMKGCPTCNGTGLHPIASEALTKWRGEK